MATRLRILLALTAVVAVVSATPATAHVRPEYAYLPDGDSRPIVISARLVDPQRHNSLLEADLEVEATDNDAVASYEYRWNSATIGRAVIADVDHPTVDYSSTRPDSRYALEIRAIDVHNNASEWFPVWSGTTPSAPQIIVAGDSIASGYTKRWFTQDATCRDSVLSYGTRLRAEIAAGLPDAWAPTYTNIAWAGAGAGAMLSGGADSCGTSHEAQVDQIQDLADRGSWNVVVITAGINSTNWTDVIVGLTKDTAISITKAGDRNACDLALHDKWNIEDRASTIERDTRTTVEVLTAETNADLFWTGYYDITGTELAPLWTPIGDECGNEMSEAIGTLHAALRSGLTKDVTWVDIDNDISTQSWAGWPHPDARGHGVIGSAIGAAVIQHS
jgi:hypothetical protein